MKRMSFVFLCLFFSSLLQALLAQQTVGIFSNTPEAFDGYTLFAPWDNEETFLINNCGEKIHSWPSEYRPGAACYLMENGNLVRAGRFPGSLSEPGILEIIDWSGNVIWSYSAFEDYGRQHHDIEVLPNGNILIMVWDYKTSAESQATGRSPANQNYSEQILEIKPNYATGEAEIVWRWRAWDHLVQQFSETADNYGLLSEHPERINVNFNTSSDWLHFNGINYNAELDQILISVHRFSEIWILDHSTSTEEAASSSGGNSGKGGDILFRWGNPQTYNKGTVDDRKLFNQHNAQWIEDPQTDKGKIILFNNKAGIPENLEYSTINVIDPPLNQAGSYDITEGIFEPQDFDWTYKAPHPTDFYSSIISGVQRLPNGNTLVCEGKGGRFFEINNKDSVVWEYTNPINHSGPIPQGNELVYNDVFRCDKYPIDFPGFAGKDLSPSEVLETGSAIECALYPEKENPKLELQILPNPAKDYVIIQWEENQRLDLNVELYSMDGKLIFSKTLDRIYNKHQMQLPELNNGIYLLSIISSTESWSTKLSVMR